MLVTLRDYRVKTVRPIDKNPSHCWGVAGSYFVQTKKQYYASLLLSHTWKLVQVNSLTL